MLKPPMCVLLPWPTFCLLPHRRFPLACSHLDSVPLFLQHLQRTMGNLGTGVQMRRHKWKDHVREETEYRSRWKDSRGGESYFVRNQHSLYPSSSHIEFPSLMSSHFDLYIYVSCLWGGGAHLYPCSYHIKFCSI